MSDEYKFAAQTKMRFPSRKGELTVEQLFDLPLKSQTGNADLDTVARTISTELKTMDTESFVDDPAKNPRKDYLSTALNIVKDVIKTKQEANAAAVARARKQEERRKILDIMAAKKDQALSAASLEDLQKQLDALDE